MSAHPYKAQMLDQLAIIADELIRVRQDEIARQGAVFIGADYASEPDRTVVRYFNSRGASVTLASPPALPNLSPLARIRAWWKRPRRHGFVKSGAEL